VAQATTHYKKNHNCHRLSSVFALHLVTLPHKVRVRVSFTVGIKDDITVKI